MYYKLKTTIRQILFGLLDIGAICYLFQFLSPTFKLLRDWKIFPCFCVFHNFTFDLISIFCAIIKIVFRVFRISKLGALKPKNVCFSDIARPSFITWQSAVHCLGCNFIDVVQTKRCQSTALRPRLGPDNALGRRYLR